MLTAADTGPLQIEGTDKKRNRIMPIGKYFKGDGAKVMDSMQDTYKDPKKAKQVFYATANKEKQNPEDNTAAAPKRKSLGKQLRDRM